VFVVIAAGPPHPSQHFFVPLDRGAPARAIERLARASDETRDAAASPEQEDRGMPRRRVRPLLRPFHHECRCFVHFAHGRHDPRRRALRRERARARRVPPRPYLPSSSRDGGTFARRSARPLRASDRHPAAIQASRLPKPPRANHPAGRNYGARSHCLATPDSSQAVLPQHQELPSASATSPSAASASSCTPAAASPGLGAGNRRAIPLHVGLLL
jgi:hypothetical protein